MGGRRTTKEELAQLEALTKEGWTARDIAQKLDRSPAAIRNLRYKKHLATKAEDETKALFQQRDDLRNALKTLQGQKTALAYELESLNKEKQKLEAIIYMDRTRLENALAQGLVNLKQQRPDLFTLSGPEQIAMLLKVILR
jgi:IS30 family transposase